MPIHTRCCTIRCTGTTTAVDLLREFPRLPLYHDWDAWVKMGRELLDLHIGFEDVEPYALERVDKTGSSQAHP